MPSDRERVESLFEAALELEPERRRDFVVASCGTNDAMRAAVLDLLTAHARQAGVLDVQADLLFGGLSMPVRLGAYRLEREIGRGGMGVVYDAERDDGQFRRRVAIKILRHSSDPELLHRILSERQILAGLDHPNIARLLDGGITPDGRPYLVMEHVDGLPIDVYCERMRLTVIERLQLFVVVARAVDFAHRNLIVHRDLKPSNILVTPDGRPKLLDFGVAKLLHPWMMLDAPMTRERQALTLEYASPEQLRGESLTTTTDVYSLGVVLYELLAGRRPYQEHEGSMAAHAAAVCEDRAERTSIRVLQGNGRGTDAAVHARARQTTPARLAKQLRGDVDAILEMALRVEPVRRYGSAELIAQDIERHLTHRPVLAYQGGRAYVLGRLVRRHRLQAAAVIIALTAVLLGAGAASWQAAVARRERERAERALADAEQVAAFMVGLFELGDQPAPSPTVRDLVRRGTARIDQLDTQPDVQARMLGAIGAIHESLGEYEAGQSATERALALLRDRATEESAHGARLLVRLGTLLRRRGEYDSAQAVFFRALDIQERVLDPADPELSRTLHSLANIAVYRGDFAEAERRARAAIERQHRTLGEAHRMRVNMLTELGTIQRARADRAGAEQTLRQAVALRPHATGSTRHEILNDRFQLATTVFGDTARAAEAEALFRAELPSLNADTPEDLYFITWGEGSLAELLSRRGDLAGAEQLRRHVLELRRSRFGPEHPATAESMLNLGGVLLRMGRLDEARQLLVETTRIFRDGLGDRHPAYAGALVTLSDILVKQDQLAAADSAIALAHGIRLDRYGSGNHSTIDAVRRRALIQVRMGRFDMAESLLRDALSYTSDDLPATMRALHAAFADLYTAWGRPSDASRHRALAG